MTDDDCSFLRTRSLRGVQARTTRHTVVATPDGRHVC